MKIVKDRTFRAKVTVAIPDADQNLTSNFNVTFKALSRSELTAFKVDTFEAQDDFLRAVIVGWDGVTEDRDGRDEPMPFTTENLNMLLDDPLIQPALLNAWGKALADARRGN